ncbi:alpha-amylase family glycosyl hydrolase [Alteromonas sp. 1_MG-2023]|uniref:alpha-amylase family glycosyl hydrolase n=1 Tax=Alteromonas sp. 1_MG-2023 TaxID=3062669 RepID=UPI0026E4579C|nr:alpha-amylase family glycosyl hydrolase [Alteromonas sp. 1_MG-2023]MDO6474700.1 alpha-amylase family glycosyl hydrolase [Alteromonas sp. 1_MG-2023]
MSAFNGVLGVSQAESGYQFAVWAPNAKSVCVTGTFNEWDETANPLESREGGIWVGFADNAKNGDEYKFAITTLQDELLLKNDPRARKVTNSVGNSVIYDDEYQWQHTEFDSAPLHERVIYEMHIGTFNKPEDGHGTFASAIEKLPELKALGVTMVELMPVNEFAGDISWGYNPAYPFAVEEAYGGPDGLKAFIDAAHGMGIGVILDVVYNHLGPSDLDIWQFDGWHENDKGGIYFYNDYRSATPWGDTRPDYGRQEVRDYLTDNALMWLNEFKADGLRMDMVPYMRSVSGADTGDDDIPEAYDLIKTINHRIQTSCPGKMTIAEDLHSHEYITDPLDKGGCGYTAQWAAGFVHPVRDTLTKTEDSYVDLSAVINAITRVVSGNPFARVVYTESHDEVANGQARLVEEVAPGGVDDNYFARQKGILAGVLTLTTAGIPMLFQGQDFKESGWFDDTSDIDWERKTRFAEYAEAFTQLVGLRTNKNGNSAALTGGATEIVHKDDDNKVLIYKRSNGLDDKHVYVMINFSGADVEGYRLNGMPPDADCLFAWQDGITTNDVQLNDNLIHLTAYSAMIFSGS